MPPKSLLKALPKADNPLNYAMKTLFYTLVTLVLALSMSAQDSGGVKNVNPKEAAGLIQEKKVEVLDIRTPAEFKTGHIAGAKNIDFNNKDFEKNLAALDKSKPVLVHCASGGRSGRSLELFKKLNFKSVYHLDGGFKAWEKAGQPVEK